MSVDRAWTKSKAHPAGETVASRKERAMQRYSDFFKTLHDEQSPTGYLGHGTHYSVLRAVGFHGPNGERLRTGKNADFAVIWDEDHDTRVIKPIEEIYRRGLLSSFLVFAERKGTFSAILSDECRSQSRHSVLQRSLNKITQNLDDPWPADVLMFDSSHSIIKDNADKVMLYLRNLVMLWNLGVKSDWAEELPFDPVLLTRIRDINFSVRTFNCLDNDNVIYLGDLVQLTEADVFRKPNMGRRSVREIKETLVGMGLHLGMDVPPPWPPENIEVLAQRYEELNTADFDADEDEPSPEPALQKGG
jgi:Bacterial RNA polymerase, alpha chain C terminal domain